MSKELDHNNKNDFVVINLFSQEECLKIIEYCQKNYKFEPATVGEDVIDDEARQSSLIWLKNSDKKITWFRDKIRDSIEYVNDGKYRFDLDFGQDIQFTRYIPNEFYNWHVDAGHSSPNNKRKLSTTIQLSDPKKYRGGELVMLIGGEVYHNIQLEQGQAVIFPSYIPHMVTPVEVSPGSG